MPATHFLRGQNVCSQRSGENPGPLAALLEKHTIKPVEWHTQLSGFYLVYFLIQKKDVGFCPILDLRGWNKFLMILPFRMLQMADVLQSVAKGAWFMSIDLRDATGSS